MRPNADAVTRTPGTTTINSSVCVFTKPMTSVAPSPSAKISPCISRILYLHGHRHQKYLILADVVSVLIDPAMMKRTREKPGSKGESDVTAFICETCGVQHAPVSADPGSPPARCAICDEER